MGEMTQAGMVPIKMFDIVEPPRIKIKGTRAACRAAWQYSERVSYLARGNDITVNC
jgi:hypothetical protein